ncbi:pyrroloquinoline quinone synthesis related protease (pqqF). Metallo peptidase. MEROPS family M16A [Pseudomonas syringae]|uniref:pyrroloquinoline quinone biosynthesis protein PqqF n=1 Tax=Pseudomonas syringae TaxID=317 RepID=UPI0008E95BE8|nr:pyrroloquinoline quinone biosynthesis protein PqqF [Pseudomonas syringae]SFI70446.1 pyrroloquinoline quinone synthesis related protease (pqqF). Metallo peptidase. MEROPS family M16A [Pseudomonas syringae]
MPAAHATDTQRLTLANGLDVVLCHEPRLKRCAASLRVAAGSHDAPRAWPGLAHFLEHLFFLGTERFPAGDNLMTFVQRHGGQVNASTRERTTDFFFELPQAAFAQGLERLCDMLAKPRMDIADQLREREVLHAEFIAWLGDSASRDQARLLTAINPQHPLRGFHAGNRYSLLVPNPAFQQALKDFYRGFYQAGQMTLCLTGPLPMAELQALATNHGAVFASGVKLKQRPPPALMASPRQAGEQNHLLFAVEDLPDKADEAVAFFCHWLNAAQPGGLVAELLRKGLGTSLHAAPLYQFGGQLLLDIEFTGDPANATAISSLLFSWLSFFKAHWPTRIEEYHRLEQRRLQMCGALALANHHCRETPSQWNEQGQKALSALLSKLTADVDNLDPGPVTWRLPARNPFLDRAADDPAEAALYLRWQLPSPQPAFWRILNAALKPLVEDARQAGVTLTFTAYGPYWQLQLNGLREPMVAVLQQSLQRLQHPDGHTLEHDEPVLIPIRQLLKQLADHYLRSDPEVAISDLPDVWAASRWSSLTSGFDPARQSMLDAVLNAAPGVRQTSTPDLPTIRAGKHWATQASPSSEDAVLVFCPAPTTSIEDEAAWRVLAHLAQAPFYQRLRVELQLGYAVFSGLRQIDGRTGLLFGVQSPTSSAQQLFAHIEAFIGKLPQLVRDADLREQANALAAQFEPSSLPQQQRADLQWQAQLAGHRGDHAQTLQRALSNLDTHSLLASADQLISATGGWLIVANRPASAAVPLSLPER